MRQTLLQTSVQWQTRLRAARWLWVCLAAFGITRLGIALVAYVSVPLLPDPSNVHYLRPDNTLLDVFGSRWDASYYLDIAREGYRYENLRYPWVAFFPLLPITIYALTPLTGDGLVAGLLIANGALLGAMLLLHRLVEAEWSAAIADRTVWYMLIFPTSFFGSAVYSESLLLLSAVGALYLARRSAWLGAAALGICATLSRLVGLIVAPMLLAAWWEQRRNPAAVRPPLLALLAPAAAPLGTAAYMFYLQRTFGDPLAFLHASAAWNRMPRPPWVLLEELLRHPAEGWRITILAGRLPVNNWIDLGAVVLFLILGVVLLSQRRWSEGIFVVLGVLIPFSSGLLDSQRRYVWLLFPTFVLLARWGERPWVDRAITACSLLGLGLFTAMFANWYWVA